jgi:hypothetical protein
MTFARDARQFCGLVTETKAAATYDREIQNQEP